MRVAVVPFQLYAGERGPTGPTVRAVAAGRSAEATLELPPLPAEGEALGLALGRALFPPPIRQLLLDVARGADEAGARVQIQLQLAAPELEALPWEWASLGSATPWRPALREDYTLVRFGNAPRPRPPLPVHGPLRLLIACAPGVAAAAGPLGRALADAVGAGRLAVDLLRDTDPLTLREALAEEPCHALHLVADDASGQGGAARLRLGRGLDAGGLVGILADHPDLRLVTLAAPGGAEEAVAAVAAAVYAQLGTGALALGDLDHAAVAAFCGPCYAALALGDPADLAVTDGRAALADAGLAWGRPRAWLAPGGEQLFDPRPEKGDRGQEAGDWGRRTTGSPEASPPGRLQSTVYHQKVAEAMPVGTPLRPLREQASERLASRATPASRSFEVQATTVGEPAQRPRREVGGRGLLQPKLLALLAACALLALMVSRVLPGAPSADTPPADATASALTGLMPTGQAAVAQLSPLSVPQPRAFATYIVAADETLAAIAERAGSEVGALAALNGLAPDEPLRPGRPLVVPIYRDGEPRPLAPIVSRGNPSKPMVALTFDIEIDDTSLYSILDVLEAEGVRATFFVTGSWVQSYPAAAKAIVAAGHEVANHSFTHPTFSGIGPDGAVSELEQTERIVREVMGVSSRPYFRFPYGDSTPEIVEAVARSGYVAYHWSADDFAIPSWLAQAAASPAGANGGILLMHGRPATADALAGYIGQLKAAGLTPTTLGEVLR